MEFQTRNVEDVHGHYCGMLGGMNAADIRWDTVADALHLCAADREPPAPHGRWIRENAHTHAYAEMAVCLAGPHAYGVQGRLVTARPGSVWLLPGGIPHDAWYGPFHAPCLDLWVHFFPRGFTTLNFAHHSPSRGVVLTPLPWPGPDFDADARRAAERIAEEKNAHRTVHRTTEHFLLYLAGRLVESLEGAAPLRTAPEQNRILGQIKDYIAGNLTDDLRLQDLAKLAGYSPFHFHRIFRETEGVTPRRYVEDRRLERARTLLDQGLTVTSAALEAGFSSPGECSRVFRRAIGVSPTGWLRREAQDSKGSGKIRQAGKTRVR